MFRNYSFRFVLLYDVWKTLTKLKHRRINKKISILEVETVYWIKLDILLKQKGKLV